MHPTDNKTLVNIVLSECSVEDLKKAIETIQTEIESRTEKRKKELWGNVMAALRKYYSETGDEPYFCNNDGDNYRIDLETDEPGWLYIANY